MPGRFGALHDELICDQIVMCAANPSIQDNLWAKGEASLQEVTEIGRRAELTGRCVKAVIAETNVESTEIKDTTIAKIKLNKSKGMKEFTKGAS